MRASRSAQGFTLIELMIVIVVIGILAALAIPRFSAAAGSAKQHEANLLLKQIYSLQEGYYERRGHYTNNFSDLAVYGWVQPALEFFDPPTISGGGPGSTTYTVCMLARDPTVGNRSINQDRVISSC